MKTAIGATPGDTAKKLTASFVKTQNVENVDTVTETTQSTELFKKLTMDAISYAG